MCKAGTWRSSSSVRGNGREGSYRVSCGVGPWGDRGARDDRENHIGQDTRARCPRHLLASRRMTMLRILHTTTYGALMAIVLVGLAHAQTAPAQPAAPAAQPPRPTFET